MVILADIDVNDSHQLMVAGLPAVISEISAGFREGFVAIKNTISFFE